MALMRKNAKDFDQLKAQMATAPMPSRPEPRHDRFVIQTDASNTGAVLTEVIQGKEKVLEFAIRTMAPAERNYSCKLMIQFCAKKSKN